MTTGRPLNRMLSPLSRSLLPRIIPLRTDAPAIPLLGDAQLETLRRLAEPGDILLLGKAHRFVHAAIYEGAGRIIHATWPTEGGRNGVGVFSESLEDYVVRTQACRVQLLRVRGLTAEGRADIVAYARRQIGKPYDYLLRSRNTDAFYCTQLPWAATRALENAPDIPTDRAFKWWRVFTVNGYQSSPDLETLWRFQV